MDDKKQFLGRLTEALQAPPDSLQESDRLQDLEGWDSIGALSVIALLDETYGITVDVGTLWECQTVGDLMKLAAK